SQRTGGLGVDAVVITAATSSTDPINFAGEISRKRGRVVVVGAVPTAFERDPHWYRKELELRMSCSYGPGRYDPEYEEKGHDYPAAYVRWTERRNMESFQELITSGRIDLDYLTTHRFPLDDAGEAYDMILSRSEPFLGILIEYDISKPLDRTPIASGKTTPTSEVGVAFIGAGSYAQGNLLPNLPDNVARRSVLTNSGTTSKRVADKFGFVQCVSTVEDILDDQDVNTVFIATRHDSHGEYTKRALQSGKHVFVEKPVCLNANELDEITEILQGQAVDSRRQLMVGYNRRFSPHAAKLKASFSSGPKAVTYRVNAGAIPGDSWIQDREIGGGRIIGEGCHFIDFIAWLCDSVPVRIFARTLPDPNSHHDTTSINVELEDGSIGTVHYFANGGSGLPKEYVEVHQSGASGVLVDFRQTTLYGKGNPQVFKTRSQDKGQTKMMSEFFSRITGGGEALLPHDQMYAVMDACFAVHESIATNQVVDVRKVR
ncbi:MAG: Gfo/Idh/MocA family oxidoreductase, partial [Rubripirellula sp.]